MNKSFIYITSINSTIHLNYKTTYYSNYKDNYYSKSIIGELRIRISNMSHAKLNARYLQNTFNMSLESSLHTCNYVDIIEEYLSEAFIYYQLFLNIQHHLHDQLQQHGNNPLVTSNAQQGYLYMKQCEYCRESISYRLIIYTNMETIQNTTSKCYLALYKQPSCISSNIDELTLIQHFESLHNGIQKEASHRLEYSSEQPSYFTIPLYKTLVIQYTTDNDRPEHCDYIFVYRIMYSANLDHDDPICSNHVSLFIIQYNVVVFYGYMKCSVHITILKHY